MEVHHLFIFSDLNGKEADELVNFGFIEGASRIHTGQGTCNRKFYFKNFYLEILWVYNQSDFLNPETVSVNLHKRALFHSNGYSPFGICLINPENGTLFKNSMPYAPGFLPEGLHFEVLSHPQKPYYPWTFHPPFVKEATFDKEFVCNQLKLEYLTKIIFHVPFNRRKDIFARILEKGCIFFEYSAKYRVTLEFDSKTQGKEWIFRDLPLNIVY
jgi:hypothetical protein